MFPKTSTLAEYSGGNINSTEASQLQNEINDVSNMDEDNDSVQLAQHEPEQVIFVFLVIVANNVCLFSLFVFFM